MILNFLEQGILQTFHQLDEKLIIVGKGKRYGQIMFVAGGAGSGIRENEHGGSRAHDAGGATDAMHATPHAGEAADTKNSTEAGSAWPCRTCGFENDDQVGACEMCGRARPLGTNGDVEPPKRRVTGIEGCLKVCSSLCPHPAVGCVRSRG